MGIGRTNVGGSGGLNLKIVGGTTQPTNPAENTIWVNTDVAIPVWHFSAKQPENMNQGAVWFKTVAASNIALNALKKNEIRLCIESVNQYTDGELIAQNAAIYQSGKWTNIEVLVPYEYQRVEYLQSSGSQIIWTGVNTNDCYGLVIDVQSLTYVGNKWFAGNWNTSSMAIGMAPSNKFQISVGSTDNAFIPFDMERHTMGFKGNKYIFDDLDLTNVPDYANAKVNQNMPLFTRLTLGDQYFTAPSMRLFRAQMYDASENLIRDFVPCYRKSDSVAGLWDRVNKVFYTNSGSGTFIVGADA